MVYDLTLLQAGKMRVPGSEVFWMQRFDEELDLTLWVTVVRGHGRTVLINTGCDEQIAELYAMTDIPKGGIAEELHQIGIDPTDVTDVIITPFQAYAIGNLPLFSSAQIHLSRRGWIDFHAPKRRQHPHDIRERCIPSDVLKYLVIDAWERVHLLEDEDQIAEGINIRWAGCHHRNSIAISVSTEQGIVVLSDAMFYEDNVTQMRPIGINESMEECLSCYERMSQEADHLIPLYDPLAKSRYETKSELKQGGGNM